MCSWRSSRTPPLDLHRRPPGEPVPRASFDTGLDLGPRRPCEGADGGEALTRIVFQPTTGNPKSMVAWHDLDEFRITAVRPTPMQVDGSWSATLRTSPSGLRGQH